jgi:hypothetical protein
MRTRYVSRLDVNPNLALAKLSLLVHAQRNPQDYFFVTLAIS